MDEHDWLAERFEADRTHLRAVAYRMLGSVSGRARAARPVLVGGSAGLVWMQHGRPQMVFDFTIADG